MHADTVQNQCWIFYESGERFVSILRALLGNCNIHWIISRIRNDCARILQSHKRERKSGTKKQKLICIDRLAAACVCNTLNVCGAAV